MDHLRVELCIEKRVIGSSDEVSGAFKRYLMKPSAMKGIMCIRRKEVCPHPVPHEKERERNH